MNDPGSALLAAPALEHDAEIRGGQLQLTGFSSVLSIHFCEDADVKCSLKCFRALQARVDVACDNLDKLFAVL